VKLYFANIESESPKSMLAMDKEEKKFSLLDRPYDPSESKIFENIK
jgi:hypothetical protein